MRPFILLLCLLSASSYSQVVTYGSRGPGGVGDSLSNVVWLRAANIKNVTDGSLLDVAWKDSSGNNNDASQSNPSYQPVFLSSGLNGRPTVQFNGENAFLDNMHTYDARTVFIVYAVNSSLQDNGELGQAWGNYQDEAHVAMDPRGSNPNGFSFDGTPSSGTRARYALNGETYGVFNSDDNYYPWSPDTPELVAAEFESSQPLTRQVIGSLYPQFIIGDHQFGGEISEIIVYKTELNEAQKIIVENSLASYYNIDISAGGNDLYSYEASHPFDVAGIGRATSTDIHDTAYSSGILGISDPDDLNADGEFLFFGHDKGSFDSWTSEGLADTAILIQRINRTWAVEKTGDPGKVTISVDTTLLAARPDDYKKFVLLVDDDGDFTEGVSVYEMTSPGNDSIFQTASIDLSSGNYISIGAVDPTLQFATSVQSGFESTDANLNVYLNYLPQADVTFDYFTSDGTAVDPDDYTAVDPPATTSISAGSNTTTITVGVVNDIVVEASKSFTITLENPSGENRLGSNSVLDYTIHDDDNPRKIYFSANASTGNEGDGSVQIAVQITPSEYDEVNTTTVDYIVTGGTATGSGVDYILADGTISIPPYTISESFTLEIIDDAVNEPDETIVISLSNPTNSSLSSTEPILHTFTIVDNDDVPVIQFSGSGEDVDESAGTVTVPVQLSAISSLNINCDYIVSGTAGASDHDLSSGSVTIPAGSLNTDIVFTVIDDAVIESTETIVITLQDLPVNAALGMQTTYTVTIDDNDAGMGFSGPGGVGDSLINKLWLRADHITGLSDGEDLTIAWPDTSGNSHDASQSNAAYLPTFVENSINGLPAVRLNGAVENDYLDNAHTYNARTVFAVYQVSSTLQDASELGQIWGNYAEGVHVALDPRSGAVERGWSFDGDNSVNASARYGRFGDAYSGFVQNDNSSQWSYDQFELVAVEFENTQTISRQVIGSLVPAFSIGQHQFGGDIAELIVYNTALNSTQRIIIENYLAAKYLLDIASAGIDYYNFQGSHGLDVAGIGRLSNDDYHLTGQSAGILTIGNAVGLDNNEFLLFGHDNGDVLNWVSAESPADSLRRVEREWVFDETGDVGEITISIDTSGLTALPDGHSGYYILLDDDGDFSAGATAIPLTNAGGYFETTTTDISSGTYGTIATKSPVVSFQYEWLAASESAGTADIVLQLSDTLSTDVLVDFTISGGTATEGAGSDFTVPAGPVTIPAGDLTAPLVITINDDLLIELEETVIIDITGVSANVGIGSLPQHTFTISDNDNDGFTGPGGVGNPSINSLWLMPEALQFSDGDPVTDWPDSSGNGNNALNLAPGQEPHVIDNQINGYPVVRFDASGQEYLGNNTSLGISGSNNATVFIVANNTTTTDDDNTGLFIGQTPGSGGTIRHYGLEYEGAVRFNNGNRIFNDGFTLNNWRLGTWRNAAGDQYGQYELFMDGTAPSEVSSGNGTNLPNTSDDLYYIGAGLTTGTTFSSSRFFSGDMAEMIVYHYELNDAQRTIVENYMAAKYHDYITISNDYYDFGSSYGKDVAGIGRTDVNNFHTAAQSARTLRISNASDLDDNEFLLFGHNGADASAWSVTGTPDDNVQLLNRKWRISESGDVGTLTVRLDTSLLPVRPSEFTFYNLWIDDDGDFTIGAAAVTLFLNGDSYEATGVDISHGDYVAIGVLRPVIQFEQSTSTGFESESPVQVDVSLNYPLPSDVSIDYEVSASGTTATGGGTDFSLDPGNLTIPAGEIRSAISFTVTNDLLPEPDEYVEIELLSPSPVLTLGSDSLHLYTISDDDYAREIDFAIGSSSGSEAIESVFLTIQLNSADPVNSTSVDYYVSGGTALQSEDFILPAGTAVIPANEISTSIPLQIINDYLYELDETITVTLTNPQNANLGTNRSHVRTIVDDDPPPEVEFINVISNGSEASSPALVPVGLSAISGLNVSVDYTVTGGTATGGGIDYTLNNGTLTIPVGDSIGYINIELIDDDLVETEETIILQLSNVSTEGVLGTKDVHTFTINNDDFDGFSGPGGVGNSMNNTLWLSADSMVVLNASDVINWGDLSGNIHDARNLAFGQEPELITDELNSKPVIRFDDNGGTNGDYLGADLSLDINGSGPASVFMVARNLTSGDEDNTGLFIGEASGDGGKVRHYGIEYNATIRFNNGNRIFNGGYPLNGWSIGLIKNASGALYGEYEGYLNGTLQSQLSTSSPTTLPSTSDDLYYIGAGLVGTDFRNTRFYYGDMAEMIVFNTDINEAQRIIIENYLSSKYALPVAEDRYSYDLVHGNHVAGIGMTTATNLHTAAQSDGILKIFNADDLDNGEFLLFGHDNNGIGSWTATETPGSSLQRITREWRFNLTGDPGNVNVAIDTAKLPSKSPGYEKYILLLDANGDFTAGAQVVPLTVSNGEYVASGVSISNGDYITIGVVRQEVSFSLSVSNQSEGTSPGVIDVALNYPSGNDITIDYSVTGGTATGAGEDYTLADGSLLFSAGLVTAQIVFEIEDDFIIEGDETIIIELSNPSEGYIGSDTTHLFTINDNDNPRLAQFTVASGSGGEGTTPVPVNVELSAAHPTKDLKIAYRVTGGTASGSGEDYSLDPDTLLIPAGNTSGSITIDIIDDLMDEPDETIIIELTGTGSPDVNLGSNTTHTYTITDNDDPPEIQFTTPASSGAESFQTVNLNLELSTASGKDIQADLGVSGGTATDAQDYSFSPLTITIPAGSSSWTEQFTVVDDGTEEASETIVFSLSNLINVQAGGNPDHTYTILDDDGLGWTGPGGVANQDQNIVWLNSTYTPGLSDGDPVTTWIDLSGNNNDGKQTGSARPSYLNNSADNWNQKPVVRFDYGYSQYLGIDNTPDLNTGGPYDKRTIIVPFRTGTDISTRQVLYEEGGTVRGLNIYIDNGELYISGWNETDDDGGATTPWYFTAVTTPLAANTPYFAALQFNFTGVTGDVTGWINGDSINVLPGAGRLFDHPGEIGLGGMNNGSVYHDGPDGGYDHFFNGNISELIINNTVYNLAQSNIVNNYLSAKYNVPITNDYYDHETDYSWGVFGIGQEDLDNSHSVAQGNGMVRIDNPGNLDNGDYLLIGHNNGDISSWTDTSVPENDPNIRRIERIWRADDRNNDIGTIRLALDQTQVPPRPFGYSKYVLLVNSSGDFTTNTRVIELAWNASLGMYSANNIDLSNDKFFTIGVLKPAIQFEETASNGFEDESPAQIVVALNYLNNASVTASVITSGVTATENDDYLPPAGSITIPAGQQSDTINLSIINDTDAESDETVQLILRDPGAGHIIGQDSIHTYTILDDDNLRKVQFAAESSSGSEAVISVPVRVLLNQRDDFSETRVAYEVTAGTATGGGIDYTLAADTVTFLPGDTIADIIIPVNNDLLNESDETIIITLSAPENANLGDTIQHTYTILDNDPVPTVQFRDASSQGSESFSPVSLVFELSAASGQDITVFYATSGGTAINGGIDYTLVNPSSFIISAGTTVDSSSFTIFNDIIEEDDETVVISIDSVRNATLGAELLYTYTIFDDDGLGWIGPGGVSDDGGYQVWLKSDEIVGYTDGDLLDNWEDASTNNNDATATGGVRPVYRDNPADNINERPVVDFSGGDYYLELANSTDFNTGGPYTRKTLVIAFETGADVTARQVLYEQGGGTRGLNIYIEGGLVRMGAWNLANDDAGATTPWGYAEVSSPVGPDETHYAILEYNADSSWIKGYVDGNLAGSETGIGALFNHAGEIGLGGMNNGSYFFDGGQGGNGYYFGGKITEFLSFNKTFNEAQKIIIENYLGAKYNITTGNDKFLYETSHSYEVFGIGRENSANSHIVSQGSGIVKLDNPENLNNGEYFFAGHDNGDITLWTDNEIPLDSVQRIAREWKMGGAGDIGQLRLSLDTTRLPDLPPFYDYYLLMVDTDGDGDFNTGTVELNEMDERFGEFARVSGLDLNEGDVVTFGAGRNITLQSGNWNDPDTWLLGVPGDNSNAIILDSHTITLTGDASIGFLSIAASGTLNLDTHTLYVTGDGIENLGTFNAGSGSVNYSSDGSQCIAPLSYYNLMVSGTGTKTLCGDIIVQHDLEIIGFPANLFLDADAANDYSITIAGDWRNGGTFIPQEGTVTFNGGNVQQLYRNDGAIENFYNLAIDPGPSLDINHDIVVAGELLMNGGNLDNTGHLLTLGINDGQPGMLTRSSGTITGQVRRWLNAPSDNGTDILFPVGTSGNYRPFTINFDNISGSGTLTAGFVASDPGSNGLPIIDAGVSVNQAFPEGYWPVSRENGFAFSGNYDVGLFAGGFSTFQIDTSTRVLARLGTTSNWQMIGDHVNAVDSLIQRENISGNIFQFGVGSAGSCEVTISNCPTDITVNTDPGLCSAVVSWSTPTALATCGSVTLSSSHSPGDLFPLGVSTVQYIATDTYSNADTCEFTVTVLDNESPVISGCPSDITVTADDEYCGSNVNWTAPTASDNCGVTFTSTHSPGDFFTVGTTTVTYTAEDAAGNIATCSFNVTVDPATAPAITGDTEVCTPVEVTYSTPLLTGKTYQWTVTGGTIDGSDTGHEVDVTWTGTTPGSVEVEVMSGSGCTISNSINVIQHATPVVGDIESNNSLTRR